MSLGKAVQCAKRHQAPLPHSTRMSQLSFTLPGKVRDRLSRETRPPFNFPHSVSVTASSTISRKHRKRFSLPASAGIMSASSCQTNQIAHRKDCLSRHLLARTVADLSLSLSIYIYVCVCAPRSKVWNWLKWWKSPIPFFLQTTSNNSSMRMALPYTQLHVLHTIIWLLWSPLYKFKATEGCTLGATATLIIHALTLYSLTCGVRVGEHWKARPWNLTGAACTAKTVTIISSPKTSKTLGLEWLDKFKWFSWYKRDSKFGLVSVKHNFHPRPKHSKAICHPIYHSRSSQSSQILYRIVL